MKQAPMVKYYWILYLLILDTLPFIIASTAVEGSI